MSDTEFTYDGIDLRTATVFDLTDDKVFLNRFLSPELGIKTKEDFLSMGENTPQSRAFLMIEFELSTVFHTTQDEQFVSSLKKLGIFFFFVSLK